MILLFLRRKCLQWIQEEGATVHQGFATVRREDDGNSWCPNWYQAEQTHVVKGRQVSTFSYTMTSPHYPNLQLDSVNDS